MARATKAAGGMAVLTAVIVLVQAGYKTITRAELHPLVYRCEPPAEGSPPAGYWWRMEPIWTTEPVLPVDSLQVTATACDSLDRCGPPSESSDQLRAWAEKEGE